MGGPIWTDPHVHEEGWGQDLIPKGPTDMVPIACGVPKGDSAQGAGR